MFLLDLFGFFFAGSDSELKVFSSTAKSITAIDDTGILRVWFLLLEGLTSAIATCPRRFQAQTIDLLFEILRSISTVPGPHFSMFAITHLLLPMLQSWVQKCAKHRNHFESTFNNFKHACGQATQLVVEEMRHFLSVEGRPVVIFICRVLIFNNVSLICLVNHALYFVFM